MMQLEGPIAQFYSAIQKLSSAFLEALPQIQPSELERFCKAWILGDIGTIDHTNMLVAGDQADQFLELPGHAVIIYDAALEQMSRHTELIDTDTDCAAGSLNLLGILEDSDSRDRIRIIARR